ncbi:nuclear receptor coactivator 5 [Trichonephila clavipes]|nr:nuclear receptor coactivator 5 [Trichonephila clavipes]
MNKMDLDESRRYGGNSMDDKGLDDPDERRFDSGRGRRPPFGRGRRLSPPGRDRSRGDYGFGRDEPSLRDRSPMRGPDDRFNDRFKKEDGPYPKREEGRKDMGRFYGDEPHRDRYMDGRSRLEGPGGGFNSRFDGPVDQFKPRPMNYPSAPPPAKSYFEGFPKPNECEIIVVNRQQRAYAESVEAHIKELGILVDVLFLKDEALLTQTIDDIARRGSLYAMVISPQNETHGSVTVNILHGAPQEHRNMPLEDALKLVARNFHEHIRLLREHMERERAERGPYIGAVAADRDMQILLRMLADGRWISIPEIDSVIRYLSERRDKMQGAPGEDRGLVRAPVPPIDIKLEKPFKIKEENDVAKKEQDLQNRIMNIMNQGAPPPIGSSSASNLNPNVSGVDIPSRPGQPRVNSNMGNIRPQPGMGPNISGIKSTLPSRSTAEDNIPNQNLESNAARGESVNQPVFTSTTAGTKAPNNTAPKTSTFLNFSSPTVQQALDNLIQSGPNLLKSISLSGTNLSNPPPNTLPENPPKSVGSGTVMGPPNDPMSMQRGGMGPPRGPGGLLELPNSGQPRIAGNLDMGPPRGSGNLDMGPPRVGGNLDMGPPRVGGNLDMGPPRVGGNLDVGPPRGSSNLDMGLSRGNPNMPNLGGPGSQRAIGSSDLTGMGPGHHRGGFSNMPDMGGINSNRSYGATGMPDSGMDQQRMSDMGRMGGPPHAMGPNSNFPGQNQFGKYQGPGQHGGFSGSYNSSSNLPRQNYGGSQGMGGMGNAPRRY